MDAALSDATYAEFLRNRIHSYDFTPRQQEVIVLVFQGLSNREIAEQLRIETETVKVHLRSIFCRLNVRRRTAVVAKILGLEADVGCPAHMEAGEPALSSSCPSERRYGITAPLGAMQGIPSRRPEVVTLQGRQDAPARSGADPCAEEGEIDPLVPIDEILLESKSRWLLAYG